MLIGSLDNSAFALRPIRWNPRTDELYLYEAITFPRDPRAGCSVYLRRASVCGRVEAEGKIERWGVDVLDEVGDIVQTFTMQQRCFDYLRRKLKFRRER